MVNYRDAECPHCGVTGTIYPDMLSSTYRCSQCHRRVKSLHIQSKDTEEADEVVYDYYYDDEGNKQRITYKCSKTLNDDDEFDPDTAEAQRALRKYRDKFKNRRRYNREIIKRRSNHN